MKEIFIGRDTRNGIGYNDPSVSGEHLKAIVYDNDEIVIEDLNSTFGTFVDGRRIKKIKLVKEVNEETLVNGRYIKGIKLKNEFTTVKLGNLDISSHTLIEDIKKSMGFGKSDFTNFFATKIVPVFEEYEKQIKNIDRKGQALRLLSGIPVIRYVASPLYILTSAEVVSQKNKIKIQYEDSLRCPKCRKSLLDASLDDWKQRKHCNNPRGCDAIFFKIQVI